MSKDLPPKEFWWVEYVLHHGEEYRNSHKYSDRRFEILETDTVELRGEALRENIEAQIRKANPAVGACPSSNLPLPVILLLSVKAVDKGRGPEILYSRELLVKPGV